MKELHKLQMLAQKKVHSDVRRLTFYCKTNTSVALSNTLPLKDSLIYKRRAKRFIKSLCSSL